MVGCNQGGGGGNPQKPVLWRVSQVHSAAFLEQADPAIKRSGVTFCEHPWKGGMDLEDTEVVTAHFKMMFSLVEECDLGGETDMTRLEDKCVQHKYLCVDHSGFFSLFAFSMAWVCSSLNSSELGWGALLPSALLTGLRSQWHLWRWKAWTSRGDNLYRYLREMLLKVAGEQQKLKVLMAFFIQGSD